MEQWMFVFWLLFILTFLRSYDTTASIYTPYVVEAMLDENVSIVTEFGSDDENVVFTVSRELDNLYDVVFNVTGDSLTYKNVTWSDSIQIETMSSCTWRVTITISEVKFRIHHGFYKATISGSDGKKENIFFMRTLANPGPLWITTDTNLSTYDEGDIVIFRCEGNTGRPEPNINLLQSRTGQPGSYRKITFNNSPDYTLLENGTYFVNQTFSRRVFGNDNGTSFQCSITYDVGLGTRLVIGKRNNVVLTVNVIMDGQTAEISIPASVKINQTELRIICSPGTGFSSVLAIALKKNVSNFANMVSLITISAEGMLWGTSYSVYRRSTASGNLDSNGANLELTFNANNLTCGDAGGYSCSITGFIDGNNIITTDSEQRTLQVHALPKEMDSVVVKVNNVMTFDRIFKVGTTVQLSCTGDIGSFPNEPNPSIRFCLKRRTENLFTGVTGFPTLSEATKKNDCMYRRTSTWSYNLTASDQNIRFMCESGYGIFCESGSAKRYVNITIEQEEPGTSAQDTETSNAGVIVGAIVGALAFLFLIILLVYFLVVRRKSGGETYRTKEDVPGFNGAPEGPVYSIPSKERNSGTGREHERDRDRDRRPRVDADVGPDIPLTPPKRTELHYADLDIASKPPGTETKDRHAHENKAMDEPHTEKRDDRPYENSSHYGKVNPALSHDTEDGDVTPTRGMHDVPMGSAV